MAATAPQFPPWKTVCDHVSRRNQSVWERALDDLNRQWRKRTAEAFAPATASLTRKASKPNTTAKTAGSMAAKKVNGCTCPECSRKECHIVVDVLGNLLHVQVHAANRHNTVGVFAKCSVDPRKSIRAYRPFPEMPGIAAPPFCLSTRPWC